MPPVGVSWLMVKEFWDLLSVSVVHPQDPEQQIYICVIVVIHFLRSIPSFQLFFQNIIYFFFVFFSKPSDC